jgi:hypothetical protein
VTTLHFTSADYQRIEGRGDRVIVLCDQDRPNGLGELVGLTVDIDGESYVILKADGPGPTKPLRRGEQVALWVTAA